MKSILFATAEYAALGERLSKKLGAKLGELELKVFPDGERYMRILTDVRKRKAILLSGSFDDRSSMESFDLGCGLVNAGVRSLQIILPYFGCSTMERSVMRGEIVTAKNRARLFSAIPRAPMGNQLYTIDLHTGGIPHYFEDGLQVFHVYAKAAMMQAARKLGGDEFVLASTDAGRAKWVESLANDMNVQGAFVYKRRLSGSEIEVSAVSAQVEGKTVVIYDDMIRTGGSLIGAAKAYLEAGASRIHAITTHGIFPANSVKKLEDSGLFGKLICTDSHPGALKAEQEHPGFLEVTGLEEVLADAIKNRD